MNGASEYLSGCGSYVTIASQAIRRGFLPKFHDFRPLSSRLQGVATERRSRVLAGIDVDSAAVRLPIAKADDSLETPREGGDTVPPGEGVFTTGRLDHDVEREEMPFRWIFKRPLDVEGNDGRRP
jgi:hypothetical protein